MKSRTHSYWLRTLLLLLTLIFLLPVLTQAEQAPLSRAMKSLLGQANSMYLSRFDTNVDRLVNDDPMTFASILGVTLQRQMEYAMNNTGYGNNYFKLREECIALLDLVAKQKDYKNPKNGNRMTADDLYGQFYEGISGAPNSFFIEKFGLDPATVNLPMILAQVGPTQQGGSWEPQGKVPLREDKPNRIVIGGVEADAAESSVEAVPFDRTPAPTPQKPQKRPIRKGAIMGNWKGFKFFFGSDKTGEFLNGPSVSFNRGSGGMVRNKGPVLYEGRNSDGVKYYVVSENQVDPYTIEYEAYVEFPKAFFGQQTVGWMYSNCNWERMPIKVSSDVYKVQGTNNYRVGPYLWKGDCRYMNYESGYVK